MSPFWGGGGSGWDPYGYFTQPILKSRADKLSNEAARGGL
jgi:hypothetical protein